eukprot:728516-Karenia_brevis.AAC.1
MERNYRDRNCSFVWENLDDIVQGPQDAPNSRYDEYRSVDFDAIDYNREAIRDWVVSYDGTPRISTPQLRVVEESFVKHTGAAPSRK